MKTFGCYFKSCRALLAAALPLLLVGNGAMGWKAVNWAGIRPGEFSLHLSTGDPEARLTIERPIYYGRFDLHHHAESELIDELVTLRSADFVNLHVSADPEIRPYEVEIKLTGIVEFFGPVKANGEQYVDRETGEPISELSMVVISRESGRLAGPVYRESLVNPDGSSRHYEIVVQNLTWDRFAESYEKLLAGLDARSESKEMEEDFPGDALRHAGDGPPTGARLTYRLDVTLRPVNYCAMSARVTGDVNDAFFGDVAYFNALEEGAASAAGTVADPEMRAMAENIASGMEGLATDLRDMGIDAAPDSGGGESFSAFLDREFGGSDTFGLTLQDFKIDEDVPSDLAAVIGEFAGGFSLGVSGIDVTEGPALPDAPRKIQIHSARAAVGAVDVGNVEQIVFELVEGTPGFATLNVVQRSPHFIYGTFEGRLYTKKKYRLEGESEYRQLNIHLKATFSALQGALTCVKAQQ